MERFYQNTVTRTILALMCCALWGSAFPCVKIGYELFRIEGSGSQILFAGYRFFLAGVFTFILACVLEKGVITMKKSSVPYVFGQGILQTTVQYVCFYIGLAHTTGAKGSVINASNAFFSIIGAFPDEIREAYLEEGCGLFGGICRDHYHQSGAGSVEQRLLPDGRGDGPGVRVFLWTEQRDA